MYVKKFNMKNALTVAIIASLLLFSTIAAAADPDESIAEAEAKAEKAEAKAEKAEAKAEKAEAKAEKKASKGSPGSLD